MIVAPEFVFRKVIGDFFIVWQLKQKIERYTIEDNVE
jgi:hypothetical protein